MINPLLSDKWIHQNSKIVSIQNNHFTNVKFTDRQQEVIACLMLGMPNKQIADKLFISTNTVKFHLKNIFQICGANSKLEVISVLVKYQY